VCFIILSSRKDAKAQSFPRMDRRRCGGGLSYCEIDARFIVINFHNISAVNHGLSKTGSGYPGKPQPPGRPRDDDRETRGKPKATPRRAVHSITAGNEVTKQSLVFHGVGLLRCARNDGTRNAIAALRSQ